MIWEWTSTPEQTDVQGVNMSSYFISPESTNSDPTHMHSHMNFVLKRAFVCVKTMLS